MAKVIIELDEDGHMNAIDYNLANMKALLKKVIEVGEVWLEDEDKEVASKDDATLEEVEEALSECFGRSGGGHLDVMEIRETY